MERSRPVPTSDVRSDVTPDACISVNLVVLRGVASAPPETRRLPSGGRLATLSVRVPGPGEHATSVPVALWDPPAWLSEVDVDDPLVVVGRLHRRFFQAGGATASRVEVVATLIGRGRDRRRLATAERRALDALEGLG
jgi:single-strand DNA-binding protein